MAVLTGLQGIAELGTATTELENGHSDQKQQRVRRIWHILLWGISKKIDLPLVCIRLGLIKNICESDGRRKRRV